MSRYATNEPDFDRYEPKPVEDIDVPDFDQPDSPDADKLAEDRLRVIKQSIDAMFGQHLPLGSAIDPAEHASHALIEALATLEVEIVKTTDLERARFLKGLIKRHYDAVNRLDLKASAKIDDVMERRR